MEEEVEEQGVNKGYGYNCTEGKLERGGENCCWFPCQDQKSGKENVIHKVSRSIENDCKNEYCRHEKGAKHRDVETCNKGINDQWKESNGDSNLTYICMEQEPG